MKALSKKQLISLLSMIVLSLLVGISPALYQKAKASNRLSEEQIAALRMEEKYRLYTNGEFYWPMVFMTIPELDDAIETADAFVYAEVIGDWEVTYTAYKQYIYPIRIIKDTEGKFQTGELFWLMNRYDVMDYLPQFEDGMQIVVGVKRDRNDPSRGGYLGIGTYYVTEDGYVLSAFEESQENMQGRSAYTGLPVEQLLYQLKKR